MPTANMDTLTRNAQADLERVANARAVDSYIKRNCTNCVDNGACPRQAELEHAFLRMEPCPFTTPVCVRRRVGKG